MHLQVNKTHNLQNESANIVPTFEEFLEYILSTDLQGNKKLLIISCLILLWKILWFDELDRFNFSFSSRNSVWEPLGTLLPLLYTLQREQYNFFKVNLTKSYLKVLLFAKSDTLWCYWKTGNCRRRF